MDKKFFFKMWGGSKEKNRRIEQQECSRMTAFATYRLCNVAQIHQVSYPQGSDLLFLYTSLKLPSAPCSNDSINTLLCWMKGRTTSGLDDLGDLAPDNHRAILRPGKKAGCYLESARLRSRLEVGGTWPLKVSLFFFHILLPEAGMSYIWMLPPWATPPITVGRHNIENAVFTRI